MIVVFFLLIVKVEILIGEENSWCAVIWALRSESVEVRVLKSECCG